MSSGPRVARLEQLRSLRALAVLEDLATSAARQRLEHLASDAEIVLSRGKRRWLRAMPALEAYPRLVLLKNVHQAPLSRNNCHKDGYQEIMHAIEAARA